MFKVVLILAALAAGGTSMGQRDWTDVTWKTRGKIDYDLEAHPLQIKTDSVAGSGEQVDVELYSAAGGYIGTIAWQFLDTPGYYISSCAPSSGSSAFLSSAFPVTLPVEQDKVWTITKTSTHLKIDCNDVEVLKVVFSESDTRCVTRWSKDAGKIKFDSDYDTASDGYRQKPVECVDTYNDPLGEAYRGHMSTTESGLTCQNWDSQTPNEHTITPANFPDGGLDLNYCRNPNNDPKPWCYNGEGTDPRWEDCDVPACLDWTDVTRDVKIDYDLEAHPLQIQTDSVAGSGEEVAVKLYSAAGGYIGTIAWQFFDTPEYHIGSCAGLRSSGPPIFVALPAEQDKVWTITKTSTHLKIDCNDVEVLDYAFSEHQCTSKWSQDVGKINFYPFDTASDGYRHQQVIACNKPSITDGTVSPDTATVDYQSTYSVTCEMGYTISGSSTVTCGTKGELDQTPTCQACYDGQQKDYRGKLAKTKSGDTCQAWTAQKPHSHTASPASYPDSGLEANYCRNPHKASAAWCYTTNPKIRWELCDVPRCPLAACYDGQQKDYRGKLAKTKSGDTCQAWTAQKPHSHTASPDSYPDSGLEANYCRNPHKAPGAWCYTTNPKIRWELCDVPKC